MKLVTRMINITYDMKQNITKFEFSVVGNIATYLEEFIGRKLNLDIKVWHRKRSKDSNALMWELLRRITRLFEHRKRAIIQGIYKANWRL